MKICLITKECYPFSHGGIGSAFFFLGRSIASQGHDVVLLTKKPVNFVEETYGEYYQQGFTTEWVDYTEGKFSAHGMLDYSFQLASHFEKFNVTYCADLVLYPEFDGEAYFLLRQRAEENKYPGTSFVIHYSGPLFYLFEAENRQPALYEQIIFSMEEYCIRASPHAIAPSHYISRLLADRFDLGWQPCEILPNPVNPLFANAETAAAPAEKNIVFAGRLQQLKGVDILIEAFRDIMTAGEKFNATLQMIGRDMYWPEYNMTFSQYWREQLPEAVSSKIQFTGPITQEEMRGYFQQAWLCVFPSRFEVFGNVALEAMHCGAPVLVNSSTGLAEVTGINYGLSWDGAPGSLRKHLQYILSDSTARDQLAKSSIARSRELLTSESITIARILQGFTQQTVTPPVEKLQDVEKAMFILLNRYSSTRIDEKNLEVNEAYRLKDEELKKAWAAYDQKDADIAAVWRQLDEKNAELAALWLQFDEKNKELAALWPKHDQLEADLAALRSGQQAADPELEEELTATKQTVVFLHESIRNLQQTIGELNATIREQEQKAAGQDRKIKLMWSDLQHQQEINATLRSDPDKK